MFPQNYHKNDPGMAENSPICFPMIFRCFSKIHDQDLRLLLCWYYLVSAISKEKENEDRNTSWNILRFQKILDIFHIECGCVMGQIKALFGIVGTLYGNSMERISGELFRSILVSSLFDLLIGEPKNPHFYDFGTLGHQDT